MRYHLHLAVLCLFGSGICMGQEATLPEPTEPPKEQATEERLTVPRPLPDSPATVDPQDPILQEIMRQLKSQSGFSLSPESIVIGPEQSTSLPEKDLDDETWGVAEEMLQTARRMLKHSAQLRNRGQVKQAERLSNAARQLRREVQALLSGPALSELPGAVDPRDRKSLGSTPLPSTEDVPSPSDRPLTAPPLDDLR